MGPTPSQADYFKQWSKDNWTSKGVRYQVSQFPPATSQNAVELFRNSTQAELYDAGLRFESTYHGLGRSLDTAACGVVPYGPLIKENFVYSKQSKRDRDFTFFPTRSRAPVSSHLQFQLIKNRTSLLANMSG